MPAAKEEPGVARYSSPILTLVTSVFQEAQERSNASPRTNHDNGEGGVSGETERVDSPGHKGNLEEI